MSIRTRSLATLLAVATVSAVSVTASAPASAMPERYADAGSVIWCEGDQGSLTAINTTKAGTFWSAGVVAGTSFAVAASDTALFDGTSLSGTSPASDAESGEALGDMAIAGDISRGAVEVLSGWDVDPDGRRYSSEGTRTALYGTVTVAVGGESTALRCAGWEFDTETFVLTRGPASDVTTGWWADSYELTNGAGTIGFYGEKQHELGVSLDLYGTPAVFGGERLQVRNGKVDGAVVLRDTETWAIMGVATVHGTVTETGREQTTDVGTKSKRVTELVHYDAELTITVDSHAWTGTWSATHETRRTLSVTPPKAVK